MRRADQFRRGSLVGLSVAVFALGILFLAVSTRTVALQETGDQRAISSQPPVYATIDDALAALSGEDRPEATTKLTAGSPRPNDNFGWSVAVSGDTAVVGAPLSNNGGADNNGTAYVFVRNGSGWTQQQRLTTPDGIGGDRDGFGTSVSISGDTLIVGAPRYGDEGQSTTYGAAYVFVRSGSNWTLQKKFSPTDTPLAKCEGQFGIAVAVSGDTAMIGTDGCLQFTDHSSMVHVFVRDGTTWTVQALLTAIEEGNDDSFGAAIALSGDVAAIGDPDTSGQSAQGAWIFTRCGTEWTREQKLVPGDGVQFTRFGHSVGLSGNSVVVGAPNDRADGPGSTPGAAYVFVKNGETWTQQQKLTANSGTISSQNFGSGVAILGDTLVVGKRVEGSIPNTRGEALVYTRSGTAWALAQTYTGTGAVNDFFGYSVAISDNAVIVGAILEGGGAGAAYAIDRATAPEPSSSSPCVDDIVVNLTTDQPDADLEDDVCDVNLSESGNQCTLRGAIQTANSTDDPDEILFNISGGGVQTIAPMTQLPGITKPVIIDATTQSGYSGTPLIELAGSNTIGGIGFTSGSSGSVLRGMAINRFAVGVGIRTNGITVEKCYFGLSPNGTPAGATTAQPIGIDLRGAAATNNTIGGEGELRNVISNNQFGIAISEGASGNRVIGNRIGTNAAGTEAIPNEIGVAINAASNNRIGDDTGAVGNLISGNTTGGVILQAGASNNVIADNYIGTNAAGTSAIANTIGIGLDGSTGNRIGVESGPNGNLISGNGGAGIILQTNANNNIIASNLIGTNADGSGAVPNAAGIIVTDSDNNRIGSNGGPNATNGNVISANSTVGVLVQTDSMTNRIAGNRIGTNSDGTQVLGNVQHGIFVDTGATGSPIERNVIGGHTGNDSGGIVFGAQAGPNNSVSFNAIGVSTLTGTTNVANRYGVVVLADTQKIGVDGANTIALNTKAGIWVTTAIGSPNATVEGNRIEKNLVGTNGSADIGNTDFGIWLNSSANENTVADNIVSGNDGFGIALTDGANNNTLRGNFIGTNQSGSAAIPNGGGIWVRQSKDNKIDTNLVSGNPLGILVGTNIGFGPSPTTAPIQPNGAGEYTTGNQLFGNVIGLNAARNALIGNGAIGIAVGENARGNQIGTPTGAHNFISGNNGSPGFGIFLGTLAEDPSEDILPRGNTFVRNLVGLRGDLQSTISNKVGFVLLQAVQNTIGGETAELANIIVASTEEGVSFRDGTRENTFLRNFVGVLPTMAERPASVSGATTGNGGDGIKLSGTNISLNKFDKNVIGANGGNGMLITGQGNIVVGSLILSNGKNGLELSFANGTKVGKENEGNQIAGNLEDGIKLLDSLQAEIYANSVGYTNLKGVLEKLGNAGNGISAERSREIYLGELNRRRNNVIILSKKYGLLVDQFSEIVRVRNNSFGTIIQNIGNRPAGSRNRAEAGEFGNLLGGIRISNGSRQNVIGGPEPGSGNNIANNGGPGVWIDETAGNGNLVDPNAIWGNAGPGIALGDLGPTLNDPTDADTGPNNLQNYPTFALSIVGGDLILNYQVDSAPQHSSYGTNGIYVEFFEADASGSGEVFLGSDHYPLSDYQNGAPGTRQKNLGNAAALGIVAGDRITATATDAEGNSSEFTPTVVLAGPPVAISGRVTTPTGLGLRNAIVSLISPDGSRRIATTSSFGIYSFGDVPSGVNYTISVSSKRYRFSPRVQVISESSSNLDFVGLE